MNSGPLDRVITIQVSTPSTNEFGEPVASWGDLYTGVWSNVTPLSGREFFASQQMQGVMDTRFVIRYIAGLTEKHRIVFGGNTYNIHSIIDLDDRHRQLEVLCRKVST